MSVVAGCTFFGSVLFAADSRLTITKAGSASIYVDHVQKLHGLTSSTAIGFVGHVRMASFLIRALGVRLTLRRHKDPITLRQWIPRFLRATYAAAVDSRGQAAISDPPDVEFMVASSILGRCNWIARRTVSEIIFKLAEKQGHGPPILVEMLSAPREVGDLVPIPRDSAGMLYTMRAPEFRVREYGPLEFCAIGSGQGARLALEEYRELLISMDESFFDEAIASFIRREGIASVGGLYPVLRLSGGKTHAITRRVEIPVGGVVIELAYESGRWIQRNKTTGREIILLPPWKIQDLPMQDDVFDDLDRAMEDFQGPR